MPCKACGLKQGQWPRGLCRRCDKAAGSYVPRPAATRRYLTSRQDAGWRRLIDGVEAQRQRLAAQRAVMARPERDVRIDGQWFSVVWDGRGSLYGEAG